MRLLPGVRLQVGFTDAGATTGPCDPIATGGYLGADNQLIRVRIDTSGSSPQLSWGYDNASFLYRVASIGSGGTTLALAGGPPDAFHFPVAGQLIEVLRTAAVLGTEPDETNLTGPRIVRAVAEAAGCLFTLTQP